MISLDKVGSFLLRWQKFTQAMEGVLVDMVAGSAPWLAPVVPAYLAWVSMSGPLGFHPAAAAVGAVVVEFLGLSAFSTTLMLWTYNQSKRKSDPAAPTWIAGVMAGFYLVVVLTVNVMMDLQPGLKWLAKGLLSSLSLPGAVILALRSQHVNRLANLEKERIERKDARTHARMGAQAGDNAGMDAAQSAHEAVQPVFTCEHCGESFESSSRKAAHVRWSHKNHNGFHAVDVANSGAAR